MGAMLARSSEFTSFQARSVEKGAASRERLPRLEKQNFDILTISQPVTGS